MNTYKLEIRPIEVQEYRLLRGTTNWNLFPNKVIEKALENDLFSICIMMHQEPVGIGRVIGDGAIYFYIQDVIVHPEHQGKGVGNIIMKAIENFLKEHTPSGAFIGLMAANGVEEFYEKFGYQKRDDNAPGMFKRVD